MRPDLHAVRLLAVALSLAAAGTARGAPVEAPPPRAPPAAPGSPAAPATPAAPAATGTARATPAAPPARAGPAEAAFWRCWQKDVTAACVARGTHTDPAAFEECKTQLAKTACVAERAAYEKELAAGITADAAELLAASIKKVCVAEAEARADGKLSPAEEDAITKGWRQALDVRS